MALISQEQTEVTLGVVMMYAGCGHDFVLGVVLCTLGVHVH